MKIALLHHSFWPEAGGVEHVMHDQANMLRRAGHQVKVLCGVGMDTGEDFEFQLVEELAPDYELNVKVRSVIERGQADQNFSQYRSVLVEALDKAFTGFDLIFVHNIFTMHFNLACTQALHDLASKYKMVAWTHDLVATNSDYALPNPTQPPWSLMRKAAPQVIYVAASELRADEIKAHIKPAPPTKVIPNMVDLARVFGLTPEMRESLSSLDLPARDFIFLLPAKTQMRKNIEFALEVVKNLHELGRNPLLLITGAPDTYSASGKQYGDYLRQTLPPELLGHLVFVSDFFTVQDDTMRDLYLVADCLLFPSRKEGFGLPIVEAALHRLPVWCNDMPAFWKTEGEGCYLLDKIEKLSDAVHWLEGQLIFRQQRKCRRVFDPTAIYQEYYIPLLQALVPNKTT